MFDSHYQNLSAENPEWGRVATLPWDAEIFGFPVGDYEAGDAAAIARNLDAFRAQFNQWAAANQVEIVHCTVPATNQPWYTLLPALGFAFVDYTLKIYTKSLHTAVIPMNKIPVRLADARDQESVERIAEQAFRAGRYYADPLFPKRLVEIRYRRWLANAFAALGDNSRLYVTGEVGNVTSFFHITREREEAYITIIAVEPTRHGSTIGVELCAGVLRDLQASGIKRMSSKISALNSGVMNFVNYYGWRFGNPQVAFHWHASDAPHLNSWDSIFV
ncbi:MAG: hypothetical protein WCF84_15660 [Anaerolineae bacterium]